MVRSTFALQDPVPEAARFFLGLLEERSAKSVAISYPGAIIKKLNEIRCYEEQAQFFENLRIINYKRCVHSSLYHKIAEVDIFCVACISNV